MNTSKHTKKTLFQLLVIISFFSLIFISTVAAILVSELNKQTTINVPIQDKFPIFMLEEGQITNSKTHKLLPCDRVMVNTDKETYEIFKNDLLTLNKNNAEINVRFFLRIISEIQTNLINKNDLKIAIQTNGVKYDPNQMIEFDLSKEVSTLTTHFKIQLMTTPKSSDQPNATLITTYKLVDSKGNTPTGGTLQIKNAIKMSN